MNALLAVVAAVAFVAAAAAASPGHGGSAGYAAAATAAAGAQYPGAAQYGPTAVLPGVADARRAWRDWALNCQGCHRQNGDGSPTTAPQLAGHVAKFLRVPGGRAYLARIPGIASSPLSNARLSEVVNWMLWRFDRRDLPAHFTPYTAAEIGALRVRPLRLQLTAVRRDLLRELRRRGHSAAR